MDAEIEKNFQLTFREEQLNITNFSEEIQKRLKQKKYSDFEIKNKLAEGGEGVIYSCFDKIEKTYKILKVMKGSGSA